MGLEWVWVRFVHAIVRSRAGGWVVQKSENRAAGAQFSLGDVKGRWERAEGGPIEEARKVFDEVGARDLMIVCGEPDGAEKWKPSRRGSVLPGRCKTTAGGGGGESN